MPPQPGSPKGAASQPVLPKPLMDGFILLLWAVRWAVPMLGGAVAGMKV